LRHKKRGKKLAVKLDRNVFIAAAVIGVIILVLIIWAFGGSGKIKVNPGDFESFRIPNGAITGIYDLSRKYEINFTKLLTIYALDNSFFPEKRLIDEDIVSLERSYILNYDSIDKKYPQKRYGEYFTVINNLFSEIQAFPLRNIDFTEDDYMYGDSFGAGKNYDNQKSHRGTDIFDRENIRGRLEVFSMTDGTVSGIGWDRTGGYFVEITSNNGTRYYYSHFDSLAPGLKHGDAVSAGQYLAKMGNTGDSKTLGKSGDFPVHVASLRKNQPARKPLVLV